MYPVTLSGGRVSLREFCESDLHDVAAIVGDDRVTEWLSFDSRSCVEAESMLNGVLERAVLAERTEYYLAVVRQDATPGVVGFMRLELSGVRAGKVGYAIHADHWGKGYATDALRTMVGFGFERLRLHRVSAAIGPDNQASIAVVRKIGFSKEGCIRDHVWTNGAWRDSVLYSLLESEWVHFRAPAA